jgi:glutamate synthase domain-containing protein 3
MTGGRIVVLGPTGRNFAAGMSGGIAYIWDRDGDFHTRCNLGMVDLFPMEHEADKAELKALVERHYEYTESSVAKGMLNNWNAALGQFIKVYPRDYRRVLEEAEKLAAANGTAPEEVGAEQN